RIIGEVLALPLADNVKARLLRADASYHRPALKRSDLSVRSQVEFMQRSLPPKPGHAIKKGKYPKVKLASRPAGLREG
ncbi:MAG TPA: RNA degradosome polyphosphate kinase, partial [Verrucomicrobiae bacterium]|nr:RNA degradosome polyphosphate kinase [Verrucomicrobiae bacterium]